MFKGRCEFLRAPHPHFLCIVSQRGLLRRPCCYLSLQVSAALGLGTSNDTVTGLVFLTITGLKDEIIGMPFSLYRTFVIEEKHGFNKQTLSLFLPCLTPIECCPFDRWTLPWLADEPRSRRLPAMELRQFTIEKQQNIQKTKSTN